MFHCIHFLTLCISVGGSIDDTTCHTTPSTTFVVRSFVFHIYNIGVLCVLRWWRRRYSRDCYYNINSTKYFSFYDRLNRRGCFSMHTAHSAHILHTRFRSLSVSLQTENWLISHHRRRFISVRYAQVRGFVFLFCRRRRSHSYWMCVVPYHKVDWIRRKANRCVLFK